MKKIVAVGVAFVLMMSTGMTVEARHHVSCMGRMLRSTTLCQPKVCSNGEYHLFCHEDGQDCGFWGVDVYGICDGWAHCENGYGTGTTDSTPGDQMEEIPVQPQAESQAPTAPYDAQTYNSDTNQNQTAGYGYGGHHGDWHHSSGGYGTGHHGHHGHH